MVAGSEPDPLCEQKLPRTLRRIRTAAVFDGSELLCAVHLIDETSVELMEEIKYEIFKFPSVGFRRNKRTPLFVDAGDFFVGEMYGHFFMHDRDGIADAEEVVENDTVIVQIMTVFICCGAHAVRHFVIFHDGGTAVFAAHDADTFAGVGLFDDFGSAGTAA